MVNFLIGAAAMAALLFLVDFIRKQELDLVWWEWLLTVLGVLYAALVLGVIASFLEEGAVQGALVMGLILGLIAVIWGVLEARYLFQPKLNSKTEA